MPARRSARWRGVETCTIPELHSCPAGCAANPFMSVSPGGGRHRCAKRSERRVPRTRPDDAERRDSGREGTTSELGVLPAARLRRAVPTRGRRSLASASLCTVAWGRDVHRPGNCIFMRRGVQRPDHGVSPDRHRCAKRSESACLARRGRAAAPRGVRTTYSHPFAGMEPTFSPGGGRHRCAKRSERRVPRTRPDDAERRGSGREGTTSELGVLPAARLRRAVPAPTGRTGQRSAFPCQRVALHGPAARRSSYRVSVKWAESCTAITDPIPLPGDALELSQMLPGIVLIGQELQ